MQEISTPLDEGDILADSFCDSAGALFDNAKALADELSHAISYRAGNREISEV